MLGPICRDRPSDFPFRPWVFEWAGVRQARESKRLPGWAPRGRKRGPRRSSVPSPWTPYSDSTPPLEYWATSRRTRPPSSRTRRTLGQKGLRSVFSEYGLRQPNIVLEIVLFGQFDVSLYFITYNIYIYIYSICYISHLIFVIVFDLIVIFVPDFLMISVRFSEYF